MDPHCWPINIRQPSDQAVFGSVSDPGHFSAPLLGTDRIISGLSPSTINSSNQLRCDSPSAAVVKTKLAALLFGFPTSATSRPRPARPGRDARAYMPRRPSRTGEPFCTSNCVHHVHPGTLPLLLHHPISTIAGGTDWSMAMLAVFAPLHRRLGLLHRYGRTAPAGRGRPSDQHLWQGQPGLDKISWQSVVDP
jgi:hypothetical protein